jgi:hypothetical protein
MEILLILIIIPTIVIAWIAMILIIREFFE